MGDGRTIQDTRTIQILIVSSEACHFCHEAEGALDELAKEFPLAVRSVDIRSEEGAEIVRIHRAPMPPVVLVDGELFSFGRMSVRKLRKRLGKELA